MSTRTVHAGRRLPLVVTSDSELLDELLRLAAASGTEVEVAADAADARARWIGPPIVLVGSDQTAACLRARLPQRARVVVVSRTGHGDPEWETAELLGAEHVAVLPAAEPWLVDRLGESVTAPGTPPRGRVVAIVGGRGGAGASVFAGALALTAGRSGLRTLLVDGDPLGGGLDLVLGWEQLEGLRWPALRQADGRVDAPALVRALPSRGDLVMISWDRGDPVALPADAMAAALDAGCRGRDLVVVDLPRQLDDAAVVALQAADRAYLIVPAELRATAAAARVATSAVLHCPRLAVIVRGPAPGGLKAREVARSLGLPLAGTLRPEPGLRRALERGEAPASSGRGPLAILSGRILSDVAGAPAAGAA